MYGMSLVYVKVEPRSTFTFTRGLSYIAYISFTRVIKVAEHSFVGGQR